ncbi:hypothetical protein AKJ09_03127 [Labilithrix luteola]|uniref:Uncharacterized protein n=1 Tax=Labilithrix luteola TaxID=1391654 RepID=A0A0K1PSF0_9BACT|nr:hypothetical protein AKJ09_03127 [Labilithrix luteola]
MEHVASLRRGSVELGRSQEKRSPPVSKRIVRACLVRHLRCYFEWSLSPSPSFAWH